ncbi:MAG: hypothetical protein CVT98_00770, partial [Bacteroidetes bacterium HGW-Bacteroidetes-15]
MRGKLSIKRKWITLKYYAICFNIVAIILLTEVVKSQPTYVYPSYPSLQVDLSNYQLVYFKSEKQGNPNHSSLRVRGHHSFKGVNGDTFILGAMDGLTVTSEYYVLTPSQGNIFDISTTICVDRSLCSGSECGTIQDVNIILRNFTSLQTISCSHIFDPPECEHHPAGSAFVQYYGTYTYGVAPKEPKVFYLKDTTTNDIIDKVTEGGIIKFELEYESNRIDKFIVEVSIDNKNSWQPVRLQNPNNGSTYIVNQLSNITGSDVGGGGKRIYFRARSYVSPDPVLGRSYGYRETSIDVFPKPTCNDIPTQYYCSTNNVGISSFEISNINSLGNNVNAVIVNLEKLTGGEWEREEWERIIPKSELPKDLEYGGKDDGREGRINDPPLDEGSYRIVLENQFVVNGNTYQSGHSYWPFKVEQRADLGNFLKGSIEIQECQPLDNNYVYLIKNDLSLPENVTGTYKLDNGDSKNIPDTAKINIPYPTNSLTVTLFYKTDLPCSSSKTYTNLFKYPKINYSVNIDSATCSNFPTMVSVDITNRIEGKGYLFDLNDGQSTGVDDTINVTAADEQTVNVYYADKPTCIFPMYLGKIHPSKITFNINPTHLSVCNSATNGKIKINGITNAFATVANPCTITLQSEGNHDRVKTLTSIDSYTSVEFDGLSYGSYTVKLKDGNGCELIKSQTLNSVTAQNAFKINRITKNNPSCNYNSDGSLGIEINLQREFEVSINNNIWHATKIPNLGNGTYVVYARDKVYNQCKDSGTGQKLNTEALRIRAEVTQPSCNEPQGIVTLSDASEYYYKTSPGDSIWVIGNSISLDPGTYSFYGIGENGCISLTDTVVINPVPKVNILDKIVNHPKCHGELGSYEFKLVEGVYSIYLDNSIILSDSVESEYYKVINGKYYIYNLLSKDYTLKVTQDHCSSEDVSFTVNQAPSAIEFNYRLLDENDVEISGILCNGDAIKLEVNLTGGTPHESNGYKFTSPSNPDPVLGKSFTIIDLKGDTNYTFIAEDENECIDTLYLSLSQPAPLTFEIIDSLNPKCSGNNDGEIEVIALGGVVPYSFNLIEQITADTTTQESPNFIGLVDGKWLVFVNDFNGCNALNPDGKLIEEISLSAPNPMSISIDKITMPTCHGRLDGRIEVSFSGRLGKLKTVSLKGGALADSINYEGNSDSLTFENLGSGDYIVSFKDSTGQCSIAEVVTINQPDSLTYSLTPTNASCFGSNTGKVDVEVIGGNLEYSIGLINESITPTKTIDGDTTIYLFENLKASAYQIELSDSKGCDVFHPVDSIATVYNPPTSLGVALKQLPADCYGTETGQIIASANGGWGEYKFSIDSLNWNGPFTEFSFDGLSSNSYRILVRDSMNCVVEQSIEVEQPVELTIENIVIEPVSCHGGENGSIEVFASGGNGGYQYKFGDGDFVSYSKQTQLISRDYSIIVRDSKGCEATQSVFVPEPQPFNLAIDKNTYIDGYNIRCYGQTDTVWLTPSGATAPYSLAYDNGFLSDLTENNQITISELVADIEYSFTFTDNNGCEYIEYISLIEPDTLSIENIYLTEPTCHNGSDGSIEVKGITGGALGYTLTLEGHQTSFFETVSNVSDYKFEGLKSDSTYELTITDSNGCSISRSIILNQPTPVIVDKIDVNPVTCKGDSTGSAVVKTIGGNESYKYFWYNDNEELISTLNTLDNQPAGTYKFSTKDINGCLAVNQTTNDTIFTVTIEEPLEKLIINEIIATKPSCYGLRNGILSIESSGGWNSDHKYSLNSSAFIQNKKFKDLSSQNYTVKVTDDKGCIIEQNVYLAQPDSFELTAQIVDIDCYGNSNGVINLSAIGGNGDYLFGFKDSTQNTLPSFENLKAGSYDFWAKDKKGCTAFLSAIVNQPEKIGLNSIILENPTCGQNNGSIEVQANGGIEPYSINWTNHDFTTSLQAQNLSAGIYFFTLSDFNECSIDSIVILNSLNGPVINVSSILEPSCSYRNDGSIEILIEGDTDTESILWANSMNEIIGANQNLSNIGKGNYFVKVSDSNNCITSIGIALDAPSPITASITKTPVICADDATGTSTIEITGGTLPYSVNWFNNDNEIVAAGLEVQILSVGSYYASISDQKGCGLTSDANNITPVFHIDEPQQPLTLTIEDIQKPTCFGGNNAQISLKAEGGWSGYSFAIDGQSPSLYPIFGNLASGEYVATVTDENGCIVSLDITVADPLPVSISLLEQVNVRCSGGNDGYIRVSATNGLQPFSYSITNGATWVSHGAFNQLTHGNYTIIARDINQCASTIDVAVTQPESLVVSIDSLSVSYCGSSNGFVSFVPQGGVAPYKLQWDNQPVSHDFVIENLPSGLYAATIFDTNQCTTAVQVDIAEVDGPKIISHSVITPKCHNSTDGALQFDFDGVSAPFAYFLNGASVESSDIRAVPAGSYKFRVVDNFGCADSININLSAPEPISITLTDITHPLCFGYNSGSIMTSALGGTPPLSFEWSNGNTSEGLQNIGAGEYKLFVTDDNLCSESVSVNIVNPEQIAIDLPKSISLCQGQVAVLDAQNPGSMYWWSSSNGLESYEREITVTQPGDYYLQVTNEFGCFALDTVKIEFFDYTVNSTLLVPSNAMVGDTIVIIDISWPIPNEIEWIIPNEFTVLVDNPYDKQLIPNAEGTFTIGLVSYTGECMALSEK